MFDSFYSAGNEVCFNTSRGWTGSTSLVKDLFPASKMIVCVRELPWILDSFEQLNSKNPYTIKPIYNYQELTSVYDRTRMLMGEGTGSGYVINPLAKTKQAMYSNDKDMLCVVEYDKLAKNPKESMQKIYQFLNEPWFEHDFSDVEDSYDEFDEHAKIKGLHTIKKVVEFKQRRPILPEDLWQQYTGMSFWKNNFDHIKKQICWIG
jgi:sulfotransferase